MPGRLRWATVSFHISAVLYVLVGIGFLLLPWIHPAEEALDIAAAGPILGILGLVCLALAVGVEVVVTGLRRGRYWAWVAGLCLSAVYLPSLFLPLGAFGLAGLLDAGSRQFFGVDGRTGPPDGGALIRPAFQPIPAPDLSAAGPAGPAGPVPG